MLVKMLLKDCRRNKIITAALFIFIMLAAFLVASASNTIMGLISSLDDLFNKARAPHFIQMHAGDINQDEIDSFVAQNSLVKKQQTVEMLGINGANIFLGSSGISEENSVMDISFITQSDSFDLLLNLKSDVVHVLKGDIAVPIYYMQQNHLDIGDTVRIASGSFEMQFTISDYARDALMNPSLVSSKRFVIHESDFAVLKSNLGEVEYLVEFLLIDLNRINEFANIYQASTLPQKGPTIEYKLLKAMNALTDGIVAVVIILVSLLLIAIAILCLRFTIIATMEEDYREIGIMKAIGISGRDISGMYLAKYIVLAVVASLSGYVVSLFTNRLFTSTMTLYMGVGRKGVWHYLVPIIATALVCLIMVFFCWVIMRRLRRITAVEAIRSGGAAENRGSVSLLPLRKSGFLNVNVSLGLKDVLGRFKAFGLLCFIFVICSFIIIVPVNLLNTMQSSGFITYMGTGRSDMRIDLQRSDNMAQRFELTSTYIANDKDVKKYSPLITCAFKVLDSDGVYQNINVEIGDFLVFPLEYLSGAAPASDTDIALSYLNAQALGTGVGDTLQLMVDGQERTMMVSGVYQDVTNGGKTAKALLPYDPDTGLWFVVIIDLQPGVDISAKIDEYAEAFYPARITHIDEYLSQTLGSTISQLKLLIALAIAISLFVSMLVTSLFLKMLIAKDSREIAIMKSIGFTSSDIRVQYMTRALLVLGIGIFIGTIASNTLGQSLAGLMGSFLGIAKITFVINPMVSYVLCPLMQMAVVSVATVVSLISMRKSSIAEMIAE